MRWNSASGAETLKAQEYIEMLEREVRVLREQVDARQRLDGASGNDLMRYLNTLEPQNLKVLNGRADIILVDAEITHSSSFLVLDGTSSISITTNVVTIAFITTSNRNNEHHHHLSSPFLISSSSIQPSSSLSMQC